MAAAYLRFLSVFHNTGLQFVGFFLGGGPSLIKTLLSSESHMGTSSSFKPLKDLRRQRMQTFHSAELPLVSNSFLIGRWLCFWAPDLCELGVNLNRWSANIEQWNVFLGGWDEWKNVIKTCEGERNVLKILVKKSEHVLATSSALTFHFLSSSFKNQLHSAIVWLSVSQLKNVELWLLHQEMRSLSHNGLCAVIPSEWVSGKTFE